MKIPPHRDYEHDFYEYEKVPMALQDCFHGACGQCIIQGRRLEFGNGARVLGGVLLEELE